MSASFSNGTGNFSTQGPQQNPIGPPACFHETEGPINVSSVAYADNFNFQDGVPIQGTQTWSLKVIVISGLVDLIVQLNNSIECEIARTWSVRNGSVVNPVPGVYITPIASWCDVTHTPPDYNPTVVTTVTFPTYTIFQGVAACYRFSSGTSETGWICGPGLTEANLSVTTTPPQPCTKTL